MKRRSDWEQRLVALVEQREARPFEYGRHDCCLWAAAAVRAQTGVDVARGLRGYRSARGAARTLISAGFDGIEDAAAALLGPRIAPLLARRGDIVSDGEALGVMWAGCALFVGEGPGVAGLVRVPLRQLKAAWRVGDA